ncbi:MAG: hypothetical protein H7Y15_12975, partial [Pseudonocardia sp.]|nr:hypothetical protein [Pseudonocardia sp.]
MRRWVSVLVVLLGVLHVVSELLANRSDLVGLARRGVGGVPSAPDSQSSAFYSVLFGVLAAAAGQVMFSTAVRHGTMSVVPGVVLIGVGAAGAWLAPRSPFWGAIVVGVLVVVAARRPP